MLEFVLGIPWQDWVFSFGNIFLFIALIPSIRSEQKPALGTSIPTALVLTSFAISFASLSLWFGAVTVALAACGWYILAFQRLRHRKTQ